MSDMPQRQALPPAPDHERHDAMLVAQLVAGDTLDAAQQAEAQRLVSGCGACAALATDLRHVSAAVAQEPVPPRRRDFRLSPEQAEELSGNALTRFLRRLSLPSARAFQPAAAGVLSIGLAFVVAGYVWPDGGTVTVQAEPNFAVYGTAAPTLAADDGLTAPVVEPGTDTATSLLESDPNDLDVTGESGAEELEAVEPDAEFFETLPDSQAGDLERSSQKSMAGGSEAIEEVALERPAAQARDAQAAREALAGAPADEEQAAADAVAVPEAPAAVPEAPAAESAQEDVLADDALDGTAALDAAAEEPAVEQGLGAVEPAPEAVAPESETVGPVPETETDVAGEGAVAVEVAQTSADEGGPEDLLIVLGVLLALTGGGLLLLSWLARRARDPLAP